MTREQWLELKGSYATEEIMARLSDRIEQLEFELARSVGEDPKHDLIRRGYILGLEDLLKIDFEEEPLEDGN